MPYGVGGKATMENIRLLCRAHNRYESGRFYGPGREYGGIDLARDEPVAHERRSGDFTRSGTGGSSGQPAGQLFP